MVAINPRVIALSNKFKVTAFYINSLVKCGKLRFRSGFYSRLRSRINFGFSGIYGYIVYIEPVHVRNIIMTESNVNRFTGIIGEIERLLFICCLIIMRQIIRYRLHGINVIAGANIDSVCFSPG